VTMEEEAIFGEMLSQAQATRRCGGVVIVQVKRMAKRSTLPAKQVKIPGILVDLVVVEPEQRQTYETYYSPAYAGELRVPLSDIPALPLGPRKIIARRAAMELFPGAVCNLGSGISTGIANVAAAFFQGFPISSSSSRTPVAEAAGARTQLTGVVGAIAIAVLLMLAPQLLQNLPHTALAAVVIAAAIGLVEISDLRRIYRIQRWEFWLSMVCFAGVAVFGAIPGIALAIVIAVIEFLWDGWRPHFAVLGSVDHVKGYHDITRYPEARLIPGLVLFRWDAPLFFANAELFHQRTLDAVTNSPTPVRWLVVAAEPVTSVDVTAADVLSELDDALHAGGIELCFAEMKDPVKDKLKRFGLFARLGEQTFFTTIDEAVSAYRKSHALDEND